MAEQKLYQQRFAVATQVEDPWSDASHMLHL